MSLISALNTAQNSLFSVMRQTSVVSRNVSEAGNEDYTRRYGVTESTVPGVNLTSIRRGVDASLTTASLQALADNGAQQTISTRLDELHALLNGGDGSFSPSALLTDLHDTLQTYSAAPSDRLLAQSVVESAKRLSNQLNTGSAGIQSFRASLDRDISRQVDELNGLLARFQDVNTQIVSGTRSGTDVNDALDARDKLLKDISSIVPVSAIERDGNDLVLITKDGATLFETVPRTVTFDAQPAYGAATVGNPVRVDGVPLVGGSGADTTASGSLAAMLQLRDSTAPLLQGQLDEIARGLVEAFAETDPTGGALPPLAGLFTYGGGPGIPPTGTVVQGFAGSVTVNTAFDGTVGGNVFLLRDGGVNGAAYVENTSGAASYSDRIIGLSQGLDTERVFDVSTGVGGSTSLLAYASQSLGWLDGYRSDASTAAASKEALYVRLSETLVSQTGVNIDEEMSKLLELEHSFEASARLISVVDEMLATLLAAVR